MTENLLPYDLLSKTVFISTHPLSEKCLKAELCKCISDHKLVQSEYTSVTTDVMHALY
jgi:hypothetical protein